MEVEEPKSWTDGERREMLALVGRGAVRIVRTLPDGRAVFTTVEKEEDQ